MDELGEGGKALVHCKDGIGRSVSLAACVLMTRGYASWSLRWGVALAREALQGHDVMGLSRLVALAPLS